MYEGDAYRQLIEQVIAGSGLSAVIRLLSEMLGLPATVSDEDFEPLHTFAPRGRHPSTAEAALESDVRSRIRFDLRSEPQASTAPPTLCISSVAGIEYAIAPVVLPSGVVGYVWVSDASGAISARAEEIVSHAAAACTLEMVRQRALLEGEARVRNSFLEDLLSGAVSSVSATRRRARYLGYELRGEQVVVILDLDSFMAYVHELDADEKGIQQLKERFRRSVDACVPGIWRRTMIWEHSDSIVILAPTGKDWDTRHLHDRVETLRNAVERRLAGPTISASIGRAYDDLTKLQHSYREAEHALRIGVAVNGPAATTVFEELGVYRLLFLVRDQPELHTFCDETIGTLILYDEEHKSHLLETLTSFLDLQGNLSQTARELHLHRNGLLYRLSRIEKVAGCDLSNPSQRLALQVALLARPMLQQKEKAEVPNGQRAERRR